MIKSLLYLMATRPDILFATGLCARFQASPRESHLKAVKRIFRYLTYTLELGLFYSASSLQLSGFSDADYAGCKLDCKSSSGTCQFLGLFLVSWSSRKQSGVALSTTKAEFVAAASCCSQLIWMIATLRDNGLVFTKRVPLFCDSTSAISVGKNPCLHSRSKHIDIHFHFLRDQYEKGVVDLIHVDNNDQLADILTKPLEEKPFIRLRGELGVVYPFQSRIL